MSTVSPLQGITVRFKHNSLMTREWKSRPKVTHCIIQVQQHLSHTFRIEQWDALMLKTAVKKYYIGLGKNDIANENQIYKYLRPRVLIKANLLHPLIRINLNGFKGVKCPTISGTYF